MREEIPTKMYVIGYLHESFKAFFVDFRFCFKLQFSAYCSSKWAIEGLSKCVAKGVAEGMAVVALDPGFICTDMLHLLLGDAATRCQSPQKWYVITLLIGLNVTQIRVFFF